MLDLSTLGLTPLQQAIRSKYIGGSDALAIVTGDWPKLWAVKTGRAEPDDLSNNLAVIMGQFTEPLNIAWFKKQTGRAVTRCGEQVIHRTIPYLGCTLDGFVADLPAPLQCKHVARLDDATELRYTAQLTHEAVATDCDRYVMSVFIGNNKWEMLEGEVDPFFREEYLEQCRQFWLYIEQDVEPPAAQPLPVPPPRQLMTVDMESSNEWCEWAYQWLGNRPAAQLCDRAAKHLKAMVEPDVGIATGAGVTVKRGRDDRLYLSEQK